MTATATETANQERVQRVLGAVREANRGNPDAQRFLNGEPTEPEKPAEVPVNSALNVGDEKLFRPNGEQYFVRKLGGHDDVAVLRKAREEGIFPILKGPPGTGKTALIEAAFGKFYTIQGTGDTDTADFEGGWIKDPAAEGGYRYVEGRLIKAADEGVPLYVDEIAQIDPRVSAILYPFMDGRGRIETSLHPTRSEVVAQPGFFIIGAFNPGVAGVQLSEALESRFLLPITVPTDYDLAKQFGVHPKVVLVSKNMDSQVAAGEAHWAPQLRDLIAFRDMEKAFGQDFALRALVNKAPEGSEERKTLMSGLSRELGKGITPLKLSGVA